MGGTPPPPGCCWSQSPASCAGGAHPVASGGGFTEVAVEMAGSEDEGAGWVVADGGSLVGGDGADGHEALWLRAPQHLASGLGCADGSVGGDVLGCAVLGFGHRVTPPTSRTSVRRMAINKHINCQHCGTTGYVDSKQVKMKQGISGGKATAAVFTAGISMLGTGLSRKQAVTEMRCTKCKTVWHVA